MKHLKHVLMAAACAAVCLFTNVEASATLVARQTLAEQLAETESVVVCRLAHAESRERPEGIVSYLLVDVRRTLAGDVREGLAIVRMTGGRFQRETSWVHGSPELEPNRDYLLFLAPNGRGAYTVAGLASGAWDVFYGDDDRAWISRQTVAGLEYVGEPAARDEMPLDDLLAAIEENRSIIGSRVEGRASQMPDEYFDLSASEDLPAFALGPNGVPIRWPQCDTGGSVSFTYNADGFGSPVPLGPAVEDALAAWHRPGQSSLRTQFAGENTSGRGWKKDGVNRVSVDSTNQIAGSGCSSIIAIGGFTGISGDDQIVNGVRFRRGSESDVLLNEGYCDLYQNPTWLRYILTHELGHALGLGHSADQSATMYGFFITANANRGAALGADDIAGMEFIYPPPPGPPAIVSISPASVEAGTTATIAIAGSNLTIGGATSVTVAGNGIGPVSVLAGATPTLVQARFTVASTAAPGSRRVTVTTSEGGASRDVQVVVVAAPTDLAATAVSSSSIRLTWSDPSRIETEYKVQRQNGATGTWTTIATLAPNSTSYSDTGLRASKRYKYRLRVTSAAGSANSNQAQATTLAN